jgi:hypothetical protein
MVLEPVLTPFKALVSATTFQRLVEATVRDPDDVVDEAVLDEMEQRISHLLRDIRRFVDGVGDEETIALEMRNKLAVILQLPVWESRYPLSGSRKYRAATEYLAGHLDGEVSTWGVLLGWWFTHALGRVVNDREATLRSRSWLDEWLLAKVIAGSLQELGLDEGSAGRSVLVSKLLTTHQHWFEGQSSRNQQPYSVLESWLKDGDVREFIQVNRYEDVLWFNQESFEELLWWMMIVAAVEVVAESGQSTDRVARQLVSCHDVLNRLQDAEAASDYQVEKLLRAVEPVVNGHEPE